MPNFVAKASITIAAPAARVWDALVKPDLIKQYMFGTTASSDFEEGRPRTATPSPSSSPRRADGPALTCRRTTTPARSRASTRRRIGAEYWKA